MGSSATAEELRRRIARWLGPTSAFDFSSFESERAPDPASLCAEVRACISSAIVVVDAVLAHYDANDGASRALRVSPREARNIADLAAVARMALQARVAALDASATARAVVLGLASSALQTAQESLVAIDRAIAAGEGLPEETEFTREVLRRSLLVRREYARFRRDLLALPTPAAENVAERLRSAGNLIARLIGSDAYLYVRVKDRALLHELQERLRAHLVVAAKPCSEQALDGLRLWQDIEILARLFSGVNDREELVRHDERCTQTCREALAACRGTVPPPLKAQLSALVGRDEVLDRLLRGGARDADAIRARLDALAASFAARATPSRGSVAPAPRSAAQGDFF